MKLKDNMISIVTVFVSVFVLGVCNLLYTNHVQHQTEEKFCAVINTVVDAYNSNAVPASDLGQRLKAEYLLLQVDLGCTRQ